MMTKLRKTKEDFALKFRMKYLGECRVILEIHIELNRKRLSHNMSQISYSEKLIERFKMTEAKGKSTLMDCNEDCIVTDYQRCIQSYREEMDPPMYLIVDRYNRKTITYSYWILKRIIYFTWQN